MLFGRTTWPIEFMGRLSKERVRVEMRRAATLCVPSYTETFGIVYAEAMKQEMAVVARSDTGIDGHGIPVVFQANLMS